jgi:hypothetical protein
MKTIQKNAANSSTNSVWSHMLTKNLEMYIYGYSHNLGKHIRARQHQQMCELTFNLNFSQAQQNQKIFERKIGKRTWDEIDCMPWFMMNFQINMVDEGESLEEVTVNSKFLELIGSDSRFRSDAHGFALFDLFYTNGEIPV